VPGCESWYGPGRVFCLLTVGKPLYSCVGLCEHCWTFRNKTVHNCTSATSSIAGRGGLFLCICFTIWAYSFAPINKHLCSSGKAYNVYYGSIRFISRPGPRNILRRSTSFISLSNQMAAYYVLLGYDRFYPHSFLFIISTTKQIDAIDRRSHKSALYWSWLRVSVFKVGYELNLSNRPFMLWNKK